TTLYTFSISTTIHYSFLLLFFLLNRPPPISTLFPTRRSSDLDPIQTVWRSPAGSAAPRTKRFALKSNERFSVETGNRATAGSIRSEEHTSELQSLTNLVCRLLLEKKKNNICRPASSTTILGNS